MEAPRTSPRFGASLHETLESVAASWQHLEGGGGATAFQHLAWARTIRDALFAAGSPSLLVVEIRERATDQAVMLLPMVRLRRNTHTVITWLDLGVSDYAAPLVAQGLDLDAVAVEEIWAATRAVLPRCDLLDVTRIPDHVAARPNPLLLLPGCRRMANMQAFTVPLEGEAETLLRRLLRGDAMREMNRRRRKLAELGPVAFVAAGTAEEVETIFAALLRQRAERFQAIGRADLLARPEVAAFYREAALRSLAEGPVRLFGLRVGSTWIATAYGLLEPDAFRLVIPTMAEGRWRNFSPSLLLIADTIAWAKARGLSAFDFSIGEHRYKTDFGGQPRDLFEIREARSLRGHTILAGGRARDAGRAWLERRPRLFSALREQRRRLRRWQGAVRRRVSGAG